MDDSYPKICRSDNQTVRLKLGQYHSRPMSESEIRRLRDALNADAADTGPTGVHVDGRKFMIDHIRYAADRFDELHWSAWDEMDADDIIVTRASVHSMVSTCLVAVGEDTVARVTTDERRRVSLSKLTGAFGEPTPGFVAAIRKAGHEIESGPQYAGTVLHALVADLFELGYESERAGGGAATLWQVDHVDGDWPWIVDHDSLDEPEFIGPQPADVTDEQLVESVRNMLDADPGTFVIRRRAKSGPPMWTAEPPECDCWWKPNRDGRNIPTSLQYRDGRYWTDQSSYSAGQMVYSGENGGRFLVIPGGIPVCPEVTS